MSAIPLRGSGQAEDADVKHLFGPAVISASPQVTSIRRFPMAGWPGGRVAREDPQAGAAPGDARAPHVQRLPESHCPSPEANSLALGRSSMPEFRSCRRDWGKGFLKLRIQVDVGWSLFVRSWPRLDPVPRIQDGLLNAGESECASGSR